MKQYESIEQSQQLSIRRYESGDHDAVWELHRVVLEQLGLFTDDRMQDEDLQHLEAVYLNGTGEFLVAEYDGKLVAMGALRKSGENSAEVKRMRVHPDYQGRGFGKQIYEALEKRAYDLGYKTLHLDTAVDLPVARSLYEKYGFKEVGRATLGGVESVLYEKRLK